ncbi:Uncharacterized protein TOPH_03461 [Tolypocladium ophioglossoides CBS 100239]|uniref:Uncharacterized protein n=1 Tax=Tolypocladium ophioglossoides (strain CBS 100239) TaxID=1163406 RepID=A0A0L0NCB6_TOLOC|nr:Uncharacterized protein TOPH_03461 [Tolypocladium ophioglossoides CBS 100239]
MSHVDEHTLRFKLHRPAMLAILVPLLLAGVCARCRLPGVAEARGDSRTPIEPSHESARANAFHVFNAVHSAGRQWGSSLNHNGFGFLPAVMPRGTLLYHGGRQDQPPPGPEWLALEVEHAEMFSMSWKQQSGRFSSPRAGGGPGESGPGAQRPLTRSEGEDGGGNSRGYFHTYRANRDLNLLYVDGMAAAKSTFGTLDSQDLLLRENKTGSWDDYMDEWERAASICSMVTAWGFDGFMRVEIGFEVIYCDFSSGIDLASVTRASMPEGRMGTGAMLIYQLARAATRGYDGLAERLRLDFSGMVSGFFFPINISNTDPARPDLIRLGAAGVDELGDIKGYLHDVCLRPRRFTVGWQGIVDSIVSRFAGRLALMASETVSTDNFIDELEKVALTYLDAPSLPGDIDTESEGGSSGAVDRCTEHYLLPAHLVRDDWSAEDGLIHTAIETVTRDICHSLFGVRSSLLALFPDLPPKTHRISKTGVGSELERTINDGRQVLQRLMERLAWTEWKKIRRCPVDEVLFVSMYPFGTDEDHWSPGCRKIEEMGFFRFGYWDLDYFLPGPGIDTRPTLFAADWTAATKVT